MAPKEKLRSLCLPEQHFESGKSAVIVNNKCQWICEMAKNIHGEWSEGYLSKNIEEIAKTLRSKLNCCRKSLKSKWRHLLVQSKDTTNIALEQLHINNMDFYYTCKYSQTILCLV